MTVRNQIRTLLTLAAVAMAILVLPAAAKYLPAQLPDPDGKAPDTTKPVKVYILAGQSNMVGMGDIRGARCMYTGIYLTADPDAPKNTLQIWRVGNYKIDSLGVYQSAESKAASGATASIYKGAYDAAKDYDDAKPAKKAVVALGTFKGMLPAISGPHTVIVRGYIDVPMSGVYTIGTGFEDSSYNVTELDGKEVYRKNLGGQAVKQNVALEAGKRYAVKITYFKGGSTAFWMSQMDLLGKGDLEIVTKRDKKFQHLIDDKGEWTVRKDVYFYEAELSFSGGWLTVPPRPGKTTIGPEVQFGHIMGYAHDEQVLVIKTSNGNRSLGFDYRPPSSGRNQPDNEWEGKSYRLMVEGVRKTLDQIDKIVPGYKGQGYEMAGFAWWQGHKDGGSTQAEYEKHLVNMIKDVRAEFKAPNMLAVVATVGFGGHRMGEKYVPILNAQMAVSDPKKHPEFAGNVRSVDIRDFWREVDESPRSQDYHYNRNAETYMLVGDALGRAMVDLIEGVKAKPFTPAKPFVKPVSAPVVAETPEDKAKTQNALKPIVIDSLIPKYVSNSRYKTALLAEANSEKPQRVSQFLRGTMYGLNNLYKTVGINEYDWHAFGPDLKNTKWDYYSFDPQEKMPKDKSGARFRKVTYPEGMENWFAVDFDAAKASFKSGLPPFGQLDGKLAPLSEHCSSPFCLCGKTPKTLWEKEVLLIRGTFEIPPLKEGHRYRIVVGGSAHVNAGEGYAIYVNGKLLAESKAGVGKRQGGQPRGGHIYNEFRDEFQGGKVTIAATSFLRYNNPRGIIPPRGHFTLWLEEMKIPPLGWAESQ